jgi:hypothetical protein
LLSAACASAPPQTSPGSSASVVGTETGPIIKLSQESQSVTVSLDAPPAKVWSVLPGIYAKLAINTEMNDPAAMSIGTRSFTQSRLDGKRTTDWLRCGNSGSGPSSGGMFRTRLTITSSVKPAPNDKSYLVSEVTGIATPVEGTSTGPVSCASKGDLEQRIRELVVAEIAK